MCPSSILSLSCRFLLSSLRYHRSRSICFFPRSPIARVRCGLHTTSNNNALPEYTLCIYYIAPAHSDGSRIIMSSSTRPKPTRKSSGNHRSTLSLQKTEIKIHVYDLLPPGKVSTMLWAIGSSLLHSGVVIGDREYAYGGHDQRGMTGVYWTKPGQEPPGGTFRQQILQGFSFRPEEELNAIIHEVRTQITRDDNPR